jgi:hypothetical protein
MGTPFTSARNGLWDASDVDTWGQGLGAYPQTAGDVVNIGHTVTYNKVSTTEMGAITIINGGIFTFSRTMSTKLTLGHQDITINAGGELRVGALGAIIPKEITAELVWNTTTADNAKGINSTASTGLVNIYGDPEYYGSKFDYILAAQVIIPAATNPITISIYGNYEEKFLAGQELLIHYGGAGWSNCHTNHFARLAVVSTANNGTNTDINCTVIERPVALTCLVGADVMNVSRNVMLYKLGYNQNIYQLNSNRPRIVAYSNAVITKDCSIGGFGFAYQAITYMESENVVVRNGNYASYFCYGSRFENILIFSCNTGFNYLDGGYISGKICGCQYVFSSVFNCTLNVNAFGNYYGVMGLDKNNKLYGYLYSNYQALSAFNSADMYCTFGYDANGVQKLNAVDLSFGYNGYGMYPILYNCKLPPSPVFSGRNSGYVKGRAYFEHYKQVVNAHYICDCFGDITKILADGTDTKPTQRLGGNVDISEIVPQSNCGMNIPLNPGFATLNIFSIQLGATANIPKTYRFYLQTDFTALTKANLVLYAEYLDNNPAGTGHTSTINSSQAGNFTTRANQSDWSQYVEITVNPGLDGPVKFYLYLTQYEANKKVWVDPLPEVAGQAFTVHWNCGEIVVDRDIPRRIKVPMEISNVTA